MIRIFIFIILHLSALISISKADGNLIIIDRNTEKTIDSIILNFGDSATYCIYKEIGPEKLIFDIPVNWYIPSLIVSNTRFSSYCLSITGKVPIKDKIVAVSEFGDSIVIPVTILPGPFLPKISIKVITPPSKRTIRDTLRAEVIIYDENGFIPGNICIDSVYYNFNGSKQPGSLMGLLINNHKKDFDTYINQCFDTGRDTIGIILMDSTFVDDTLSLSVSFKGSTASQKFRMSPVFCKSNRAKYLNNLADLVSVKKGFIRFGKSFDAPLLISITTFNGKLIHRGIHIADKSFSQYRFPTSMMTDGCFVLTIRSQKSGIIYSGIFYNSSVRLN